MTEDAIVRLHSMTKPATSLAARMLVADGELSLGDPRRQIHPCLCRYESRRRGESYNQTSHIRPIKQACVKPQQLKDRYNVCPENMLRSIRRWRVVPLLPRRRSASIGRPDHGNPDATSGAPDAIQQIDFHRCGGGRSASLLANKWASRLCILQRGRLLHAMRFSNLPTVHRVGVGNGR